MVMSIWIGNSRFHCINNTVIGLRFAGHITRMKHVTPATIKQADEKQNLHRIRSYKASNHVLSSVVYCRSKTFSVSITYRTLPKRKLYNDQNISFSFMKVISFNKRFTFFSVFILFCFVSFLFPTFALGHLVSF